VKHVRFSYADVKDMSRADRSAFLEFFSQEIEEEKRASQQHSNRR